MGKAMCSHLLDAGYACTVVSDLFDWIPTMFVLLDSYYVERKENRLLLLCYKLTNKSIGIVLFCIIAEISFQISFK